MFTGRVEEGYLRWYAIIFFERDGKVLEEPELSPDLRAHLEVHIADCERELDAAESVITNQWYPHISGVAAKAVKEKSAKGSLSAPPDLFDSIRVVCDLITERIGRS